MIHDSKGNIGSDATLEAGFRSMERPVVVTVALSTMLAPLNSTMIAVALPEVMDDFDVGLAKAGWLVTAYLIGMASLQPVAGKIGDRLGHRPLVLWGLTLFGAASVAASVAPSLWVLVLFRVFQAVGGALIVPNGFALVRQVTPEERRGRKFGLIGATVALGAALGPLLGGLLVVASGWSAIFYVNLLVVLPALAIGWRWLPARNTRPDKRPFDVTGAVMLPVILIGAAGLLTSFDSGGATTLVLAAGVAAVVGILAVFVWRELNHPDPVLQPRLFRRRAFAAANGGIGLGNLSMYTILLSVPILLTVRDGASSLETGLVLSALSAAMIVTSPFGGRLADKFGRRLPVSVGLALLALGTLPMAVSGSDISLSALFVGLVFVGIGIGMSTPGLQTTAVESVGEEQAGVASGVYSTSRYLGSITGSAILAGILSSDRSSLDGLGTVFVIILAAALLATFTGFGLRARPAAYRAV